MREKIRNILLWGLVCTLVWGIALFAFTGGAHAQQVCTDRKGAGDKLASQYKEAPVNMGLAANGAIIEVFATEDGASFTIVLTMTDGTACMMAAGESWESIAHKLPKTGSGT